MPEAIDPPAVWIHSCDAAERGISNGQLVDVFNARGCTAISEGGWHTPDKEGRDVRGNINTLTGSHATPFAHSSPQHTSLVQIRAAVPDSK